MLRRFRFYLAGLLLSSAAALPAAAQECADVANSTLAEIQAGAVVPLTDEVAALVRRAAGSACVKALSGRYSAELSSAGVAGSSEPVTESAADDSADATSDKEESSLWPFDSLKINDVSASPSKKPYQRKR